MRYMRWVGVVLLIGVSGCGHHDAYQPEGARGRVVLNGKPLTEATVSFRPKENPASESAVAFTDANGGFDLSSRLKPGMYIALVYKFVDSQGKVVRQVDPGKESSLRNLVPANYRKPETSPLLLAVAEGDAILPDLLLTSP